MQATVSSSLDQSALAAEKGIDDGTSSNKSQTLILADVATTEDALWAVVVFVVAVVAVKK